MSTTRAERAAALEQWADNVDSGDLVVADTDALRLIAELAERHDDVDAGDDARRYAPPGEAHRSWSRRSAPCSASRSRPPNTSTQRSSPPEAPLGGTRPQKRDRTSIGADDPAIEEGATPRRMAHGRRRGAPSTDGPSSRENQRHQGKRGQTEWRSRCSHRCVCAPRGIGGAAAVAMLLTALAGCSGDDSPAATPPANTAVAAGEVFVGGTPTACSTPGRTGRRRSERVRPAPCRSPTGCRRRPHRCRSRSSLRPVPRRSGTSRCGRPASNARTRPC